MGLKLKLLVGVVVLGALGFASASIVNGASALTSATTGTTGTTAATTPQTVTVTTTATATTTQTVVRRVFVTRPAIAVLCHRTGSGRFITIRVRVGVGTLVAHLRHGDLSGRCTAAKIHLMKLHRKG